MIHQSAAERSERETISYKDFVKVHDILAHSPELALLNHIFDYGTKNFQLCFKQRKLVKFSTKLGISKSVTILQKVLFHFIY